MNDPVRVAVVGAGSIAQVAHLPVLRKIAGVEIAAICDNDLSKAQALGLGSTCGKPMTTSRRC
jgi:predicted dehydrogenase